MHPYTCCSRMKFVTLAVLVLQTFSYTGVTCLALLYHLSLQTVLWLYIQMLPWSGLSWFSSFNSFSISIFYCFKLDKQLNKKEIAKRRKIANMYGQGHKTEWGPLEWHFVKLQGHHGVDGKWVNGKKGTKERKAILRNLILQQGRGKVKEV